MSETTPCFFVPAPQRASVPFDPPDPFCRCPEIACQQTLPSIRAVLSRTPIRRSTPGASRSCTPRRRHSIPNTPDPTLHTRRSRPGASRSCILHRRHPAPFHIFIKPHGHKTAATSRPLGVPLHCRPQPQCPSARRPHTITEKPLPAYCPVPIPCAHRPSTPHPTHTYRTHRPRHIPIRCCLPCRLHHRLYRLTTSPTDIACRHRPSASPTTTAHRHLLPLPPSSPPSSLPPTLSPTPRHKKKQIPGAFASAGDYTTGWGNYSSTGISLLTFFEPTSA